MPTIRTLPKLAFVQLVKIQPDMRMRAGEQCWTDRHNRRHSLGSPEDGLFNEGSFGISCEKPTPNADGICRLWFGPPMRSPDNRARTRHCGAGIPTQFQSFPLLR